MFILTNKELRHLKAVFRSAINAYPYDTEWCINNKMKGCRNCSAIISAREYLDNLEPNV